MSRPCACGLALRPRRLCGLREAADGAPCSEAGSCTLGGWGLPSATAAPTLPRRGDESEIQGGRGTAVSKDARPQMPAPASILRLRGRALGTAAALGHELVEFGLVLGMPQTVEELLEFALFFFEAAQGLRAVFVKGTVAARGRPPAPPSARASLAALLPMACATTRPARHS